MTSTVCQLPELNTVQPFSLTDFLTLTQLAQHFRNKPGTEPSQLHTSGCWNFQKPQIQKFEVEIKLQRAILYARINICKDVEHTVTYQPKVVFKRIAHIAGKLA